MIERVRNLTLTFLAIVAVWVCAFATVSEAGSQDQLPSVTPVQGPSNFHRLGIVFDSSGMGRTGAWGPAPESYDGPPVDFEYTQKSVPTVVLSGADIYRLSCRACHQADGAGAPPEIASVIGPVQATSAAFMEQLMKQRGRPITPAFARELSSGSKNDLLNRLRNGGQKMPSFRYLTDSEINALIGYLYALANVPGSGKVASVTEPAARPGELVVKGTCHICHDATGFWPDPETLMQGDIPPISGFTSRKTLPEFIWKVRHGAPVIMGSLNLAYRGRMPVFEYLSDDEVATAYLYLVNHPPQSPIAQRKTSP